MIASSFIFVLNFSADDIHIWRKLQWLWQRQCFVYQGVGGLDCVQILRCDPRKLDYWPNLGATAILERRGHWSETKSCRLQDEPLFAQYGAQHVDLWQQPDDKEHVEDKLPKRQRRRKEHQARTVAYHPSLWSFEYPQVRDQLRRRDVPETHRIRQTSKVEASRCQSCYLLDLCV